MKQRTWIIKNRYVTLNDSTELYKIIETAQGTTKITNNKIRISKDKLIDNLVKALNMTKDELKATYLTAFLVCYMKEMDWIYDENRDTFVKVELNLTARHILIGMKPAGYSQHQIDDIKLIIVNIFYGKLTSANVDREEITLTNKEKNRRLIFKKSDL